MEASIIKLVSELPDPDAAHRFLDQLAAQSPRDMARLEQHMPLLSDVVTLAAFSPLLATTLLQNPDYIWWLQKKRAEPGVRSKDELLESLARFALTNSQIEPQVLYARFRRRELLRIYLRDIRRLATIAEITEEISNLADAILESALKFARNEIDMRYGSPLEPDSKGRLLPARFCIAALGKLGSRELNYSSDIDLLFLYSEEGSTSGRGNRGAVTNREYFIKLAELIIKLVGQQAGEGAAYRVDLRLRPHGTLGALAISVPDAVLYLEHDARNWERQVLIRSRGCAGDINLFREYFRAVEDLVFSKGETVETALENVRRSKEQIDLDNANSRGFNVKLDPGGIREIEFLVQALQLAYGGEDEWLRNPHTLISLDRLHDRKHLTGKELTDLASAYEFLRRTEHMLQMENGVQTHSIPVEPARRDLLARRMAFAGGGDFESNLSQHIANVSRTFKRIFWEMTDDADRKRVTDDLAFDGPQKNGGRGMRGDPAAALAASETQLANIRASIDRSTVSLNIGERSVAILEQLAAASPHFAAVVAAYPQLAANLPDPELARPEPDYEQIMRAAAHRGDDDLKARLASLRQTWSHLLLDIVIHDVFEKISIDESKRLQTKLAEATIAAALNVIGSENGLAVLALGKLGGRGLDYGSDLDLIMVYDDELDPPDGKNVTSGEYYARLVEQFVNILSSMTRDGNLYRVDLRLRPYGSKGLSAISKRAFLEYMRSTAEVWEMLAFVKLRAAGGDQHLGNQIETETRRIIHQRAKEIDRRILKDETRRVRLALENGRRRTRRPKEIDIKYGDGGMLDVYFAMRYLQLLWDIPDAADDAAEFQTSAGNLRSTQNMLSVLLERSRSRPESEDYAAPLEELRTGYKFLSSLDHCLRLAVGRVTNLPIANLNALNLVAGRMGLVSGTELLARLTLHRISIRKAFDTILPP